MRFSATHSLCGLCLPARSRFGEGTAGNAFLTIGSRRARKGDAERADE